MSRLLHLRLPGMNAADVTSTVTSGHVDVRRCSNFGTTVELASLTGTSVALTLQGSRAVPDDVADGGPDFTPPEASWVTLATSTPTTSGATNLAAAPQTNGPWAWARVKATPSSITAGTVSADIVAIEET